MPGLQSIGPVDVEVFGLEIVDLTSTPEPDSLLLFAGGLSLMGLIARRRFIKLSARCQ